MRSNEVSTSVRLADRLSFLQKMTTVSRLFARLCASHGTVLLSALLLAGCSKTEVTSYRVPKEKDAELPASMTSAASTSPTPPEKLTAPAGAGGEMANTAVPTASGPGLTWTAPADWQTKPLGAMRKGSFTVVGEAGATADLSITAFPGAVGGELANINRWRGQVGLPPITDADLATAATRFTANSLPFTVVDLVSADPASPQRILGGMTPHEGAMWFFKLTGPDALVGKAKPAFLDFLKTVKTKTP
jgi:hypothetical protein